MTIKRRCFMDTPTLPQRSANGRPDWVVLPRRAGITESLTLSSSTAAANDHPSGASARQFLRSGETIEVMVREFQTSSGLHVRSALDWGPHDGSEVKCFGNSSAVVAISSWRKASSQNFAAPCEDAAAARTDLPLGPLARHR